MESASTSAALTMQGALTLIQPAKIVALQTLWATLPASDLTGDKLAAVNALRRAVGPTARCRRDRHRQAPALSGPHRAAEQSRLTSSPMLLRMPQPMLTAS